MKAIVLVALVLFAVGEAPAQTKTLALVGAKIYPSPTAKPIADGVVLVRGGKIAAVGPRARVKVPRGATVLDCAGATLVAGFWNSHVHFTEPKWERAAAIPLPVLAALLRDMFGKYGFTAVFDTGSVYVNTAVIKDRVDLGEVDGPIRTAGEPLAAKGGTPYYLAPIVLPEVETPRQATAMARDKLDLGADAIKIFAGSVVVRGEKLVAMRVDLVRAIADEAHRRGKPVLAHPQYRDGLEAAIEGGVDVLLHSIEDAGPLDAATIARMRRRNMALVPTLTLFSRNRNLDEILGQTRAYAAAGGQILFGTDVGFLTDYDPTTEYRLMARAGLGFRQILASLTTAPAARFGAARRAGQVARGMDADIVVLSDDPEADVGALAKVRYTLRGGKIIFDAK